MKLTVKYYSGDVIVYNEPESCIDRLIKELRNHKDLWWYYIIEIK